ncbi:MAG TPA: circularly permuted type 2 ATP-grasp protein, partial [Campylobacteraceae bacterium]|nr:circularly permuted type 2 ATP-grasp protein [Campylobacteraceae bacterium]
MLHEHTKLMDQFWKIFEVQDKHKIKDFNNYMEKFAVNFNLYKDGQFIERPFPFDVIPRIIGSKAFARLDAGVSQRVTALNLFLEDIYSEQRIIKDKIIPEHFVLNAKGYEPGLKGFMPPKGIRSHISGIDLVLDSKTHDWVILEDNLRVPSGASYPLSV